MGSLSFVHWLFVLVIVLLVFGTKKLRNIGGDLGGAVRGFKDAMKEGSEKTATPEVQPQIDQKTIDGEIREKDKV